MMLGIWQGRRRGQGLASAPTTCPRGRTVVMSVVMLLTVQPVVHMGSSLIRPCHRQLPPGSGFLVSDNYPFEYRNNASCTYRIQLYTHTWVPSQAICFTFHRFSTEILGDYLEVSGHPYGAYYQPSPAHRGHHRYSGHGVLTSQTTAFSSVWEEDFCWVVNELERELTLSFHSNMMLRDLGFYATYKNITVNDKRLLSTASTNPHRPLGCHEKGMSCFDRKCRDGPPCLHSSSRGCADRSDRSYAHSRCTTGQNDTRQQAGQLACDFDLGCSSMWAAGGNWKVTDHSAEPEHGLSSDHTSADTHSKHGAYLVPDFSHTAPDMPADVTLLVVAPSYGLHCLSFWYHMNGFEAGHLQVFHQCLGPNHGALWTRHGSYGDYWHHGHVTIFNNGSTNNENIVFSAVREPASQEHIALDDVSLMVGACPYYDDISCTFMDNYMCGWETNGQFIYKSEYSAQGHGNTFLSHQCTSKHCNSALLLSPPVGIGGATCLILRYRFGQSQHSGHLVVESCGPSFYYAKHRVLRPHLHMNSDIWHTVTVEIGTDSRPPHVYQVQLESYLEEGGNLDIDEINFIGTSCSEIKLHSCLVGQYPCKQMGQKACCNCETTREGHARPPATKERIFDFPHSPVALLALISSIVLILLILAIKVALCVRTKWKQRQLIRLREQRLDAIRSLSSGNTSDGIPAEFLPPSYDECTRDNPAFVLGEGSEEDKRDLPSYMQVIEEGYLMITHPVEAELGRLRRVMAGGQQQWENSGVRNEADVEAEVMVGGGEVEQRGEQQLAEPEGSGMVEEDVETLQVNIDIAGDLETPAKGDATPPPLPREGPPPFLQRLHSEEEYVNEGYTPHCEEQLTERSSSDVRTGTSGACNSSYPNPVETGHPDSIQTVTPPPVPAAPATLQTKGHTLEETSPLAGHHNLHGAITLRCNFPNVLLQDSTSKKITLAVWEDSEIDV